jgi:hypothetical protein
MSDSYTMTGEVVFIGETQRISDKFSKRCIRIDNGDRFGNIVEFEFTNDKINLVEDYLMGKKVAIRFNVQGREWKDRCFTSLNAWHLELVGGAQGGGGSPQPAQARQVQQQQQSAPVAQDDLPF